jgi:predicted transcriptional regulator
MQQLVDQRSVEKWGEAARGGFQTLPDILLKKQVELGLSAMDMMVLINITMHWWYANQRPFPRTGTIATRMGVDQRTVQRSLRKLTELGLVKRVTETTTDGTERVVCDLSGLTAQLEKYVVADPNYRIRQQRRAVEKLEFAP